MEWEELYVEVRKTSQITCTLAAKRWGSPDGEPWLFLHGWLDNASSFDLLAPLLLAQLPGDVQLVCLDLPGHGFSSHRADGVYHLIDYVADAFLMVEALQWDRFSVIGHSLGQGIGALLAGTFPSRVKRLVMIEGIGPSTDLPQEVPVGLEKSLMQYVAPVKPKRIYDSRDSAATRRMQGNVVGPLPLSAASILVSRGTVLVKDPPTPSRSLVSESPDYSVWTASPSQVALEGDVQWSFDDALKSPSRYRLTEDVLQSFLARIQCPVLLILTKDGLLGRRGAKPSLITTPLGRLFVHSLFWCLRVATWIPIIGRRFNSLLRLTRMGSDLCTRFTIISKLRCVLLPAGGHHPHLASPEAETIAAEIVNWTAQTSSR